MAVVTVYGTQLTNAAATPPLLTGSYLSGSNDWSATDVCAAGASDSAGSTYRFCRIPSNALILNINLMNDANTSGTSYKCGVYLTGGGAVAVANADLILFSALTMTSARSVWTSVYAPAVLNGGFAVANATKRIWELLNLASDPGAVYDICIAAVIPGSAGGNMALQVNWGR